MAEQSWSDTTKFIKAINIQELMDAINEWENAYSITPTSFTNDPVANKPVRSLDITEMQDALDDLKTLVDGNTFSWTEPVGKITATPVNEVQNNMNYMQDGKCYLCHTCDNFTCTTCNNTCNTQTCTCNNTCYAQSCTGCNGGCYSQVCSSCHTVCFSYNKCNDQSETCTCNSACYIQTCSICNNTCNAQTCSCNNTCYQQTCTVCNNTCNAQSCDQCDEVSNEYPW